jgi:hypothetical protein
MLGANLEGITTRQYQKLVADKIKIKLKLPVETEWRAMKDQHDLYCPRVDIAIGPFVYDSSCIPDSHDCLIEKWEEIIKAMYGYHKKNVESLSFENCQTSFKDLCYKNKTARCLIAIEIEDKVNRKHLIGAAVNVIALGRLGVVVACNPDKLNAFIRIRRYLWFLSRATNFGTTNLLVLTREQLASIFVD